jgi:hypothetical protein
MQAASFQMVGDWRKQMRTTLDQAIAVSVDVFKRTAPEACKHGVILMAQSLASGNKPITPISKKTRPVLHDSRGLSYVEFWRQGKNTPNRVYKFTSSYFKDGKSHGGEYPNWEKVQIIRNAGLARRSWMWGLAALGGKEEGRAISGLSEVFFTETKRMVMAVKRNKLGYIGKIMPAGWIEEVSQRATNKIMGQAARKMQQQFSAALRGPNAGLARSVQSFFLPEAA